MDLRKVAHLCKKLQKLLIETLQHLHFHTPMASWLSFTVEGICNQPKVDIRLGKTNENGGLKN